MELRLRPPVVEARAAPRGGDRGRALPAGTLSEGSRSEGLPSEGLARDADLVHVALDLTLDWERRAVFGAATSWCRALRPDTTELRFQARGLDVREVLDAKGRALPWRIEGGALAVTLGEPLGLGDEEPVRIVFAASAGPGLAFTGDTHADASSRPFRPGVRSVHGESPASDGSPSEGGGARDWWPALRAAADRSTFEARLRVGHDMQVWAAGELLEVQDHGRGERTFVWRLAEAVPPSSFGFVAGRFEDETLEVDGVVLAAHSESAPGESLTALAEALRFFGARTQRRYPFPRFDQLVTSDLANEWAQGGVCDRAPRAGAVWREAALDPAGPGAPLDLDVEMGRARTRDLSVDLEIALTRDLSVDLERALTRALARQWFGVYVAPLEDRERWLVEALATWLGLEFERHRGAAGTEASGGAGAVDVHYEELREELLASGGHASAVDSDLPAHYASKGAWLFRMLGARLGEAGLWRTVRTLVERHGGDFVATEDLRRAALDVTGKDLASFLDQWVDGAEIPDLVARVEGLGSREVALQLTQRGAPLVFELALECTLADGTRHRRTLDVRDPAFTWSEAFPRPVQNVVLDPDGRLCARFEIEKTAAGWLHQLSPPSSASARWRAVAPLSVSADFAAVEGLLRALVQEPEAGIRRRVLERLDSRDPRVAPLVLRVLETDPSAPVRRAAARALRQLYAKGALPRDTATLSRLVARRQAEPALAVRVALDELLLVFG